MNSDDQYTRFQNLDRSSDAAAAGVYLDRASAQTSVHTYKAESFAQLITDYETVKEGGALEERARAACAAKVISPAEEQRWLEHVAGLRDRGQFWFAMLVFTVRGIKP